MGSIFIDTAIMLFRGLCKLLWAGTFVAMRNSKYIAKIYACMAGVTLFVGLVYKTWWFMVLVILGTATALGIREYIKDLPNRKRRKLFDDIFTTMNFKASDNLYPYFISETVVSDYTTIFSFNTLVPLNRWLVRRDEIAMYFNEQIVEIRQNANDNRIIDVLVQTVSLPDCIEWNDEFICKNNVLSIGESHTGIITMNIERHPHSFIAGETGSGKSNILKCLIYQALVKDYGVVLIDFKRGVSFAEFSDSVTIFYDYTEVVRVLKEAVTETNHRLDLFRNSKVDNINDYNRTVGGFGLRRQIIFIDELAELLKARDKEIKNTLNDCIETLTRLSRAVGIHLIMGIQRPDSTIVSGQIKNNVSFRVCGRFVDPEPSRIMLSCDRASKLPNIKGRFIVKDDDLFEVQSFYFPNNVAIPKREIVATKEPIRIAETAEPVKTEKVEVKESKPIMPEPIEVVKVSAVSADIADIAENTEKKQKAEPIPETAPEPPKDSIPFEFDFSNFRNNGDK